MATLTFVTGSTTTGTDGNFVRIGHTSSLITDAVWSFKTGTGITTSVSFTFNWNNLSADGGPGVGYISNDPVTKVFVITTDGTAGRTAATTTSYLAKTTAAISGHSGSVIVNFDNLSLNANTTYYIRVNQNDSTLETAKSFYRTVNASSVAKATFETYQAIRININGAWKMGTVFVNVNGTWKRGNPYIKVDDTWKIGI